MVYGHLGIGLVGFLVLTKLGLLVDYGGLANWVGHWITSVSQFGLVDGLWVPNQLGCLVDYGCLKKLVGWWIMGSYSSSQQYFSHLLR